MVDSGGPLPGLGWLPEQASRVVLVAAAGDSGGSERAALETAELVAGHRPRTLLVSAVVGAEGPESELGLAGRAGLSEVVAGACRVKDVAVHPPERSFLFIPAGAAPTDAVDLGRSPAFRHLLDAAGRGGTLLLLVEADQVAPLIDVLAAHGGPAIDGLVLLGSVAAPAGVPSTTPVLARVELATSGQEPSEEAVSDSAAAAGFSRPTTTPAIVPGRRSSRTGETGPASWLARFRERDVRRGALGVVSIWLVAVLAVWLVWQGMSGWPAFQEDLDEPAPTTTVGDPAAPSADEDAEQAPDGATDAAALPPDSAGEFLQIGDILILSATSPLSHEAGDTVTDSVPSA